ncbi:MAG TPA: iron ABC transporter permease [Acidimicrobiales bacterium]|nr:iron ABC transporter permease [Acidimicrobiales bacterium]
MTPTGTALRWLAVAVVVLAGALFVGLSVGPVSIPVRSIVLALVDRLPAIDVHSGLNARETAILLELRAPRVVLGAMVGATLALSGAAYQGVFRNPLADPYLLGAAAGAGLGATLAIAYRPFFGAVAPDAIPAAAFVGALAGVAAAYGLGRAAGGGRSPAALVLAGVAVASFLTAVQTWVLQRNSDTLREVYDWILGRLTTADWADVRLALPYMIVAGAALLAHRRLLDVLRVGEDEAAALGLHVARLRLTVVVAASLATAAAVAVSGLIAFVGIIVPHLLRLTAGSSYRRLLPLSVLFGAAFLVLADVVARTVAAPAEVPIGVITAFVGAPFFAVVLATSRRSIW